MACGLFLFCAFALALPAQAASDIFLQVEGIPGESTDDKHKAWIEVLSFSTGVTQPGAAAAGAARAAGKVEIAPFTVVKLVDSTSPKLFINACNGKHIQKVVIEVASSGEKKQVFLKYTLSDVLVGSIRTSAAGASEATRPTEEVSFSFSKIEMEYTPQDASGKGGAPVKSSYDAATNKSVEGPSGSTGTDSAAAAPAPAPAGQSDTAAAAPAGSPAPQRPRRRRAGG